MDIDILESKLINRLQENKKSFKHLNSNIDNNNN